jgi:RNA-binding protein 23/39
LNGFELAGRAIRVGLGNDKFTNESTQAILDRYNGFRDTVIETLPRGGTERSVGGAGGGRGSGTLDDADDSGVSLQNVSREALMRKLARDEPKEDAPPYNPVLSLLNCSVRKAPQITTPTASRCVLLKDMFDPAEETGTTWVKELEDDVKAECETKYGKVCSLQDHFSSLGNSYSR